MDDDSIICCLILICIISFATGFPSVYYGQKCKNAVLRAQRKDLCKNFSNDASALALQIFGWILSIPWLVGLCYCVSKCCPGGVAVDVEVWDHCLLTKRSRQWRAPWKTARHCSLRLQIPVEGIWKMKCGEEKPNFLNIRCKMLDRTKRF